MITLESHITELVDGEGFYTFTPFHDTYMLERDQITDVETRIVDQRQLSAKQRNTIFALVEDISDFAMGVRLDRNRRKRWKDEMLRSLQLDYVIDICDKEEVRRRLTHNYCQLCNIDLFSLAARTPDTVDMTTARDFIDWLVELCITVGVPCSDSLLNRCEDVQRYLYACVMNRFCAVCGKKADIHEFDRVGMGRNRQRIHHAGQRVQPLCRLHHQELDNIGQKTFDEKYHMTYIILTEDMCQKLGWKK